MPSGQVGSLNSAEVFRPEHALIIQNKDELTIPLMLETIPAPQEFRDAIESLSPEQQAFCKAYRKMQVRRVVVKVDARMRVCLTGARASAECKAASHCRRCEH